MAHEKLLVRKTVATECIAGMAVRNAQVVSVTRHDGVSVHIVERADPVLKGGSDSTVTVAAAASC